MTSLFVIGAGMGDPAQLTAQAVELAGQCQKLYAFDRMGEGLRTLFPHLQILNYAQLLTCLRAGSQENVGVLVSGDVGFFSLASTLQKEFSGQYTLVFSCGISCLQYLCAKLHLETPGVSVVSLHGRSGGLLGSLSYNRYTFALTGGSNKAGTILKDLCARGLGSLLVTAGERLSMPGERIRSGTAEALSAFTFDSLTVLLFENPAFVSKDAVLFDSQMQRGAAPMTKQEVRWVSLGYLDISPDDTVCDVGAGTGSVSIEMARRAYRGIVYAIERKEDALALLCENRRLLGAYNVLPVLGSASQVLETLPPPNKVFVGGSGKELPRLVPALLARNPQVSFVLNAVTLETLSQALSVFQQNNLTVQVSCINAAHSTPLGSYTMMSAQNPVYILWAHCV